MDTDTPGVIRILLVDDHLLLREGVSMLIENQPDVKVVGDAAHGAEALDAARRFQPDVVLLDLDLDLDLGTDNGLDFIPALLSIRGDLRVLILTGVRDVEMQHRAIRLGAVGIVHKEQAAELLVKAIRKTHAGEVWLDRGATVALFQELQREQANAGPNLDAPRIASLSPRERQLVPLVGQGMSTQKIAEVLHIAEKTVRNHLASIYEKLEITDRLELALYASKHGLIQQSD